MAIQKFTESALVGFTLTDASIADNSIDIEKLSNVNLTIAPEVLEIQVSAPQAGQDTQWLWTWEQSTLPYARRTITNSPEVSVPLYKQGTYTLNNYAAYDLFGDMTQTHSLYIKWIDGAGTDNLVDWAVNDPNNPISDSHPDINSGTATDVQRINISVPSTITIPTLTAPSVSYTVTNNGAGAYTFSSAATGDNPNLGPFYRGGTYTFNITATGHPFYFTTDNGTNFSGGTYFGEYTDGVSGSRTDSGTITFTVPSDAPDTLYYQCGNHGPMRGAITIKNLEVETNNNGNYIIYAQHTQEGHKTPIELRPIPSLVNQMCLVYDASSGQFVPQDLATYVENTPSFENKIREVAGTAELVVEDGSAVVAKVNVYNDSTYLPLVGNNAGDQAFATDVNTLFIWDGSTWETTKQRDTDTLTEGSTNLYYTDARVDARLASGSVATFETSGNVTIGGNLTVNGSTTTINSTTLEVDDLNITLASGAVDATAADGAGITVDGAGATFNYNSANNEWNVNRHLATGGTNFKVRGTQNQYIGVVPETDINLMLGTGAGTEPRIYLKGSGNGQTDAGDVFIGSGSASAGSEIINRLGAADSLFLIQNSNSSNVLTVTSNSSRVGIGTDGPTHPLHVYADGPPSGIIAKFETTGNPWLRVAGSSSGHQIGSTNRGFEIYNDDNSSYQVAVNTNGHVGIGTRIPSNKVHVYSDSSDVLVESTGVSLAARYMLKTDGADWRIGSHDARGDSLWVFNGLTSNYALDITQDGKLGIGLSNPANTLDLGSATANRGISWGGTNFNYTNIWAEYSNGDLNLGTGIGPSGTSTSPVSSYGGASIGRTRLQLGAFGQRGVISFHTAPESQIAAGDPEDTVERMRITASGLVGIGTDNPDVDLVVDSSNVGPLRIRSSNSNGAYIRLSDPNTSADPNHVWIGANGNDTRFYQSNTLLSMVIRSDGHVGIGTNNPGAFVELENNNYYLALNRTGDSGYHGIQFQSTGSAKGYLGLAGTTGHFTENAQQFDLVLRSENDLRLVAGGGSASEEEVHIRAGSGNVGLGVNNPNSKLAIDTPAAVGLTNLDSNNGLYSFASIIETPRTSHRECVFLMTPTSNGQKYIHLVTNRSGAIAWDLDIVSGRSGSERAFGRITMSGYKYHETDGDFRHGAHSHITSLNAYGNYFEVNGEPTHYLAINPTDTSQTWAGGGTTANYWVVRIPILMNAAGTGTTEFTAILKATYHNQGVSGSYWIGFV